MLETEAQAHLVSSWNDPLESFKRIHALVRFISLLRRDSSGMQNVTNVELFIIILARSTQSWFNPKQATIIRALKKWIFDTLMYTYLFLKGKEIWLLIKFCICNLKILF